MKQILCLSITLFSFLLTAQSNSQEVIATSGSSMSNGSLEVSWTMGETVTETVENGNVIATQGFQQTNLEVVGIIEHDDSFELNAYPNPTTDILNLKVSEFEEKMLISILDNTGKIVEELEMKSEELTIDFTEKSEGLYLVLIQSKDGKKLKTLTIQKMH